MIAITDQSIDSSKLKRDLLQGESGALVVFEGWVRNHNDGRSVESLEYEAYESLCIKEGQRIIHEAKNRFEINEVVCVHRTGHLQIGDTAVWIGATAAHRGEAFKACQYVIDEIKLRLPIWKKEHYVDHPAEWVSCQHCYHRSQFSFTEANFYSKQINLKEVGLPGQEKLRKAKVLVVGAGGLGSPVLTYLAAAGVGQITICDHDKLEASNLHRQTLYSFENIGEPKAKLAKKRLQKINPFIQIEAVVDSLQLKNAVEFVSTHDLVFDCTDNFKTKFLLNDTCKLLSVPLVQASIYQMEGQLQTVTEDSSCLRCIWPELPQENCVGSCAEVGVLGVVPGVLGTLQAQEGLSLILGQPVSSIDSTILFDLQSMEMNKIRRRKNPECSICNGSLKSIDLNPDKYVAPRAEFEIIADDLMKLDACELIDIREFEERDEEDSIRHLPMSDESEFEILDKDKNYVLVCAKGGRSQKMAAKLRAKGGTNFYSLIGGISSLRSEVEIG